MAKEIKVGIRAGTEEHLWNVFVLDLAFKEAMKFLDADQYSYAASQVRLLATEKDPTHSALCSVDAIEDFHELARQAWTAWQY